MSTTQQIKELLDRTIEAFNDPSRIDEFYASFAPDFTNFYLGHDLLTEKWPSKAQIQAMYEAGMHPRIQWRHPNVQLYDGCAVFTAYGHGSLLDSTGTTHVGPWRFSATLIPHGDSWRIVHNHWSKLTT